MITGFDFVVFDAARSQEQLHSERTHTEVERFAVTGKKLSDLNARPCDIETERERFILLVPRAKRSGTSHIAQLTQFRRRCLVACAAFRRIVLVPLSQASDETGSL
jgi:hypothetical protein